MFYTLQSETKLEENPLVNKYVLEIATVLLICFTIVIILIWLFKVIEGVYVDFIGGKPLFRHFNFLVKELTSSQKKILEKKFKFYKQLNRKERRFFRHRVRKFIYKTKFQGKEGLFVNDEHLVLISATAVMLTFGYRNYSIRLLDKIIIYPSIFFSDTDKNFHKGHFNPRYRSISLSWEDFVEGFKIEDDNLNLGIHELIHALHISYLNPEFKNELSSRLFINGFEELKEYIDSNHDNMIKIKRSNYFRDYAFENHFEFISVLVENFIETPAEFRSQFPEIYAKVKQMLNFNFAGY